MPEIVVTVKNKMAVGDGSVIVCNNSDYVVRFALDSEWDALALRTMRIVYDSYSHTDIAFSGDTVALPTIIDRTSIGIGLYSGDIHTSTCAMFDCERSVMGKNSNAVAPPSSDVYNEIVKMINDGRLKGDKGADGTNGADGANGADGVTFTPSVDSAGNLSWTNDGGLSNPATVNIKGATGAAGERGEQGIPGEPGAKGDKGDPGSDANVTAENIQSALGYAPVKDVQVAGTSVMTDGVANVPIASETRAGVIMVGNAQNSGMCIAKDGNCYISYAINPEIDSRNAQRKTIVCSNLDYAVKAAMCDGKGAAWTADEQKAARDRMGVDKEYELIEEIALTESSTVMRTNEPDGTPYKFDKLKYCVIVPKAAADPGLYVNAVIYSDTGIYAISYTALSSNVDNVVVGEMKKEGATWECRQPASGKIGPQAMYKTAQEFLSIPNAYGEYIAKFFINVALPINTKIYIYGVRA